MRSNSWKVAAVVPSGAPFKTRKFPQRMFLLLRLQPSSSQLIKRTISLILSVYGDSVGARSFWWCNAAVHELVSCRRERWGEARGREALLLSRLRFWSVSY